MQIVIPDEKIHKAQEVYNGPATSGKDLVEWLVGEFGERRHDRIWSMMKGTGVPAADHGGDWRGDDVP